MVEDEENFVVKCHINERSQLLAKDWCIFPDIVLWNTRQIFVFLVYMQTNSEMVWEIFKSIFRNSERTSATNVCTYDTYNFYIYKNSYTCGYKLDKLSYFLYYFYNDIRLQQSKLENL